MNQKIKRGQVEEWEVERLSPYENNAKLHPDFHIKQIAESIEEFTFLDPIAVDEEGEILEGHGRLLAAKKRGDRTVPVIQITGLSDTQKTAYRLAHNKLTINTEFDPELLKIDFEFLKDEGFELSLTGFDELELSFLDNEEGEGGENKGNSGKDDYDPPEKIESRVKPGEIWQLGRHKIACSDSIIESNIKALFGDRFGDVSMVWSDPPCGINVVSKNGSLGGDTKGKYTQVLGDENKEVAYKSFSICQELFENTIQIFWGANHFASVVSDSSCWIVWDKQGGASLNFADCELAWTNIQQPARVFRHLWSGYRRASEVGEMRVHPTQKPVALPEWFFEKYGNANDLIFDPFLGSAPSIIAAQRMEGDRAVYGFELSPDYCEVIIQRWENFTGEKAELVGRLDNFNFVPESSSKELESLGF